MSAQQGLQPEIQLVTAGLMYINYVTRCISPQRNIRFKIGNTFRVAHVSLDIDSLKEHRECFFEPGLCSGCCIWNAPCPKTMDAR